MDEQLVLVDESPNWCKVDFLPIRGMYRRQTYGVESGRGGPEPRRSPRFGALQAAAVIDEKRKELLEVRKRRIYLVASSHPLVSFLVFSGGFHQTH